MRDIDAAEDVVSQTFIRAWDRLHTLRDPRRFDQWLFRIAHNQSISALRSQRDVVALGADDQEHASVRAADDPVAALDLADRSSSIRQALLELPEPQREVVVLRFLRELPHAEVARQTGRSEEAVRALQHRALKRLRRALGTDGAR